MQELLEWMEYIEDTRQQRKVRHTLKDILVIVLFATLANADDWVEMALFADYYQWGRKGQALLTKIDCRNGLEDDCPAIIVLFQKRSGFAFEIKL